MTQLPIAAYRDCIVETVRENKVTVLVGETGSGKTTQVPVYLLKAGFAKDGMIGITEPRRIPAISVAEYVAQQLGVRLGGVIGYQVRFDNQTQPGTRLKYMTAGILLQEAKSDPLFSQYKVVGLDEVHERNLETDFCLGLLKRALRVRDDLRVVVMSATIQAERFSAYFDNAPIITVEGRMYPVTVHYLTESERREAIRKFQHLNYQAWGDDTLECLIAHKVDEIHRGDIPGDILVYSHGTDLIFNAIRYIESLGHSDLECIPAYGDMSLSEQRRIFNSSPNRQVILSTNLTETGPTITGLVHVVDPCTINEVYYDPHTRMQSLLTVEHSKDGLAQRLGRAGRVREGHCWRLITPQEYEMGRFAYSFGKPRKDHTTPEILRSDLSAVVLRLVGLGVSNPEEFEFLDKPSSRMIHIAIETLKAIGALTDEGKITEIGQELLDWPVEPRIGRMILAAQKYGCLDEMCVIAASLSAREIFSRIRDKRLEHEAKKAKEALTDRRGDLLTIINVVKQYVENGCSEAWARDHFVNSRALNEILKIYLQLVQLLKTKRIEHSSVDYTKPEGRPTDEQKAQAEAIGKAVLSGMIASLATIDGFYSYRQVVEHNGQSLSDLFIHPSSVLHENAGGIAYVVATALVKTKKRYMRGCQEVLPQWVQEVAPHLVTEETYEKSEIDYDENVRVTTVIRTLSVAGREIFREEIDRKVEELPKLPSPTTIPYYSKRAFFNKVNALLSDTGTLSQQKEWLTAEPDYTSALQALSDELEQIVEELSSDSCSYDEAVGHIENASERCKAYMKRSINWHRAQQEQEEARLQAEEERRVALEAAQRKEEEERGKSLREYENRLAELREQLRWTDTFGTYSFEVENGMPRSYKAKGYTYEFDWNTSEVTPDMGPCWGFVTQEVARGREKVRKVALLLAEMKTQSSLIAC